MLAVGGVVAEVRNGQNTAKKIGPLTWRGTAREGNALGGMAIGMGMAVRERCGMAMEQYQMGVAPLVMLQSSSEPWFEPELFQTGPRSGPEFNIRPEPNLKSSLGFGGALNPCEPIQTQTGP